MKGWEKINSIYIARRLSIMAAYCRESGIKNLNIDDLVDLCRSIDFVSLNLNNNPIFFRQYKPVGANKYEPNTVVDYVATLEMGYKSGKVDKRLFSEDEWKLLHSVINGSVYKVGGTNA